MLLTILNWRCISKPTNQEWESIEEIWHYTSLEKSKYIKVSDGIVYLKTSRNPLANLLVFCRPAIYFFYKNPSKRHKIANLPFTDASVKVIIEAKNLEKEFVRLRKHDNTLIYLKNYRGEGKIENK